MWIKAVVLGGSGIIFPNLAVWTMAGLGITIAFRSSRSRLLGVASREETDNEIDQLPDDHNILSWLRLIIGREEKVNEIDRLPDDILCSIVSRLRVIEAFRTSVLSKRWRKIRTLAPELIFDCLCTFDISKYYHGHVDNGDKQSFFKAVNQCLELYSGQKLKAFYVHCCFLNDHTYHLVRWMQAINRLDVEQLCLGHSCPMSDGRLIDNVQPLLDKAFTFSFRLIDGLTKLLYLNLMSCYVETSFVSQFNSLMWLRLWGVPLHRQELYDILLSCPNLQKIEMRHCQLPQNLSISGPNLNLKVLELFNCSDVQTLKMSDFNVVIIKIYFRTDVEILLSSVPKLEILHLITRGMHYYVGDFPRDLPQLNYLLIQTAIQIRLLPRTFQVFGNVRVLYMFMRGYPSQEASQEVDLWNFAPVLSACMRLEEFYLTVGGVPSCKDERKVKWPTLHHKHLKYMELSGFSGTQNELEFAKFILRSAQVLKSLVLRSSWRRYDGDSFCLEDIDSKQFDFQLVRAELEGHTLFEFAKVELY